MTDETTKSGTGGGGWGGGGGKEVAEPASFTCVDASAEAVVSHGYVPSASTLVHDTWRAIHPKEVGEAITESLADGAEPFTSLNGNPFWRPDFIELVEAGHATCADIRGVGHPIELGADAIARLEKFARKWGAL